MFFLRSYGASRHLQGLGAYLRLRLTRSVQVPILLCWWANVGAECFVRMSEWRHSQQPHRAVAVGAGQQPAIRAECHPVHVGWVGGQDAVLLLLGQQDRHDGFGLVGREDLPGSDGEPPRDHGTGGVDGEAVGGQLAG